ncbi:MAG: hypothetical protein ACYDH5_12430 [Acidimicrobiales bacterium]
MLNLSLETRSGSASEALAAVAERSATVLAAVKAQGVRGCRPPATVPPG